MPAKHKRAILLWLLIFFALTLLSILSAASRYLSETNAESGIALTRIIRHQLGLWYTFGLLGMLLILFIRRFPLNRFRWPFTLSIYSIASVIFSGLHTFLFYLPARSLRFVLSDDFSSYLMRRYPFDLLIFLCILALYYGYRYFRKSQQRELIASQMQAQLVEAQLQALRMQIQPHFLFNTLHSVASIMYEDVGAAHEMITRLADLLRWSLQNSSRHEVTLAEELRVLEHYIEIQRMRFGDRLVFTKDILPEAERALVPNFILQPLVENAIRHGIEQRETGGRVKVTAELLDGKVRIQVRDNGPGMIHRNHASQSQGIGLSNCVERLKQLYNGNHELELAEEEGGGLTVNLILPFRSPPNTDAPAAGRE